MFKVFTIDYPSNIFELLSKANKFEKTITGDGRVGAILVEPKNETIPVIRTTTCYQNPVQSFASIHYDIINNIKIKSGIENLELNNAMIEIYDNQYRKMGWHTDQALDFAPNSYICIFSCYDNPNSKHVRKLKIQNKTTSESTEIIMFHNSVIIFSEETNKQFQHKIVLENVAPNEQPNTHWLGITFRLSKTYIKFVNNIPYFVANNKMLTFATEEERHQFMIHKSKENSQVGYDYPEITFTISPSDLIQIEK